MRSPDASANDLMGVALEVNLKVGEGARIIRNFDKQKQKLWLWLTLQKSVCVCAGGWGGVLNVMFKRVKKKKTPRQTTITVLGLLGVIVNSKLQHHTTKRGKPPHEKN